MPRKIFLFLKKIFLAKRGILATLSRAARTAPLRAVRSAKHSFHFFNRRF